MIYSVNLAFSFTKYDEPLAKHTGVPRNHSKFIILFLEPKTTFSTLNVAHSGLLLIGVRGIK
jgi:hypothetical protein